MSVARTDNSSVDMAQLVNGADRRGAARFTTMMRTAKLIGLTGEFPCVIRDVSETGVKLRLFHPLPEERMALELGDGVHYFVENAWERDSEAGFRFSSPVNVAEFIAALGRGNKPLVQLKVRMSGIFTTKTAKGQIGICGLSQQGARIKSDAFLAIDEPLVLSGDGLPQMHARIRSRKLPDYEVLFDSILRLDELAQLIWALPRWSIDASPSAIEDQEQSKRSDIRRSQAA